MSAPTSGLTVGPRPMNVHPATVEVHTVTFSFVGARAAVAAEVMVHLSGEVAHQQEVTLLGGETSVNKVGIEYLRRPQSGWGEPS